MPKLRQNVRLLQNEGGLGTAPITPSMRDHVASGGGSGVTASATPVRRSSQNATRRQALALD
jgi:hypothetical protein